MIQSFILLMKKSTTCRGNRLYKDAFFRVYSIGIIFKSLSIRVTDLCLPRQFK